MASKDDFRVGERISGLVEGGAHHIKPADHAVIETEGGEEELVVAGEVGIQRQVEQAGLGPAGCQRVQARHRRRDGRRLIEITLKRAGQLLGDQEFPVGQEGQRPRRVQGAGDFGRSCRGAVL